MKTDGISFNSKTDLKRRIETFEKQNPGATLDESQIGRALASAIKMDNDGNQVGKRITAEIDYTETE